MLTAIKTGTIDPKSTLHIRDRAGCVLVCGGHIVEVHLVGAGIRKVSFGALPADDGGDAATWRPLLPSESTHRENNEDRHLVDDRLQLYLVADGMGGHAAGEVAAELAIDTARAAIADERVTLERVSKGEEPPETLLAIVEEAVRQASAEVYRSAESLL